MVLHFVPSALLKFLTVLYSTVVEDFSLAEELKRFTQWLGGISPAMKTIILWVLADEVLRYSSTESHNNGMLGF